MKHKDGFKFKALKMSLLVETEAVAVVMIEEGRHLRLMTSVLRGFRAKF